MSISSPEPVVASPSVADGVLDAVGTTPLVRLRKLYPDLPLELYGKLEGLNPGGSVKDRPAKAILEAALAAGEVDSDTVVVESSSGNMGIGLAQVCRYHGLRFVCVIDTKTTAQNRRILELYGAEIELVEEPDPETGELLPARLERVRDVRERSGKSFWPNQYANRQNPASHYATTMAEIVEALDGRLDYLFAATSTCGTIRGCGEYVRDHGLTTKIIAVDAFGSLIFSDEQAERNVPGIGAGLRPELCDLSMVHECVHVTDMDCVVGCRRLVAREAILAGGSAGAVVSAVALYAEKLPPGAVCAVILCDRGERYLETIYSDQWVERYCGGARPA